MATKKTPAVAKAMAGKKKKRVKKETVKKKKGVATEIATKIGREIDKEIEKEKDCKNVFTKGSKSSGGGGSAVYGFGLIGAAVFYIQHAEGFWMGVLGLLKALVWPAILVYELLEKMI